MQQHDQSPAARHSKKSRLSAEAAEAASHLNMGVRHAICPSFDPVQTYCCNSPRPDACIDVCLMAHMSSVLTLDSQKNMHKIISCLAYQTPDTKQNTTAQVQHNQTTEHQYHCCARIPVTKARRTSPCQTRMCLCEHDAQTKMCSNESSPCKCALYDPRCFGQISEQKCSAFHSHLSTLVYNVPSLLSHTHFCSFAGIHNLADIITYVGGMLLHVLHRIMLMLFTTCHTVLPILITSIWLTVSVYATAMHMHQTRPQTRMQFQSMLRLRLLQHCAVCISVIRIMASLTVSILTQLHCTLTLIAAYSFFVKPHWLSACLLMLYAPMALRHFR